MLNDPSSIVSITYRKFQNSYCSWLDSTGVAPDVSKDLMRRSAIDPRFNVYERELSPEKREAKRLLRRMDEAICSCSLQQARACSVHALRVLSKQRSEIRNPLQVVPEMHRAMHAEMI